MPNDSAAVRSLLKDLTLEGVIVIDKRKLLWLLGWSQDRPGAWAEMLDLWKELGQEPQNLKGSEIYDKIVLFNSSERKTIDLVSEWAGLNQ
ncbi:hypothetical protein [Acidocella sp.]|uniref:hypothetical protein n=1 Tax=Acidocella sp. TaxID=50710 RepID=UPI002634376F|nr:hypothetical protein [Acidocella sp.]